MLPPGRLTWTWRFLLAPVGPDAEGGTDPRCELTVVTELSVAARRPLTRQLARIAFAVFDVGHGVMEHVQLRTLARRVPRREGGGTAGGGGGGE